MFHPDLVTYLSTDSHIQGVGVFVDDLRYHVVDRVIEGGVHIIDQMFHKDIDVFVELLIREFEGIEDENPDVLFRMENQELVKYNL